MELSDKKYVTLFQVSKMSAGRHYRNLILATDSSRTRIVTLKA